MPMTEQELIECDAKRNLGDELLQSVKQMRAEKVGHAHKVDIPEIIEARNKVGLTQVQFAELLGVSKRTLQEWE
jgi:putative transcriptional regulator